MCTPVFASELHVLYLQGVIAKSVPQCGPWPTNSGWHTQFPSRRPACSTPKPGVLHTPPVSLSVSLCSQATPYGSHPGRENACGLSHIEAKAPRLLLSLGHAACRVGVGVQSHRKTLATAHTASSRRHTPPPGGRRLATPRCADGGGSHRRGKTLPTNPGTAR